VSRLTLVTLEVLQNFTGSSKLLSNPLSTLTIHFFWYILASIISTSCSPMTYIAALQSLLFPYTNCSESTEALYLIGWQVVRLFYYLNSGGFLHRPLQCRISRGHRYVEVYRRYFKSAKKHGKRQFKVLALLTICKVL
jgi:hypothetical protein